MVLHEVLLEVLPCLLTLVFVNLVELPREELEVELRYLLVFVGRIPGLFKNILVFYGDLVGAPAIHIIRLLRVVS